MALLVNSEVLYLREEKRFGVSANTDLI